MAEGETKETAVTDSALDQAAEGAEEAIQPEEKSQEAEAVVSETEEDKTKQAEKEEQRERSALGRKVKMLEEKLDKFFEKAESFYQNPPQHAKTDEPAYQGDELLTVAEVEKYLEQREVKKARQQNDVVKKYQDKYLDTFARLGAEEKLDDDEFTKVDEIMRKSFNMSYSNYADPTADAERNFLKAVRAYEKDKSAKSKSPNLKGDTPKGTGVGGTGDIKEKPLKMPELDPYAKDFVNYHKMKEDRVAKTLGGETPMRLRK